MNKKQNKELLEWVKRKRISRIAFTDGLPRLWDSLEITAEVIVESETKERLGQVIELLKEVYMTKADEVGLR